LGRIRKAGEQISIDTPKDYSFRGGVEAGD